jgi:hypothetical protein
MCGSWGSFSRSDLATFFTSAASCCVNVMLGFVVTVFFTRDRE